MAVNLSPVGNGFQFFTTTGIPLAGGKIYTYQAGSSTALATYTDNGGVYANTNPIVLGSDGRPSNEIWLTYGYNYKFVLKDANDVTIQTYDNLYGIIGTQTVAGTTIPTGMISLWYGAVGSVPSGWYLCDGTDGTPDLRDRFIVGAGNNYAVGATGGYADAVVVDHTHTASSTSVVTDPGHTHFLNTRTIGNSGGSGTYVDGSTTNAYQTVSNTTGITVSTTTTNTSSGVSGTDKNIPPYYALAYVMKSLNMATIDATEARLSTHEEVCAMRYETINSQLEAGTKRMDKMEFLIYAVLAAVLFGPGAAAKFFAKLIGL